MDASRIAASAFAGCVITAPAVSPWLQAAQAVGCSSITGADMFLRVRDLMVDFLLDHHHCP